MLLFGDKDSDFSERTAVLPVLLKDITLQLKLEHRRMTQMGVVEDV